MDVTGRNLQRDGFMLAPAVLGEAERAALLADLGTVQGAGQRGLLARSEVADFARSETVQQLLRPHLAGRPRAVRTIFFDKAPESNWIVAWHQDLTLALAERVETPGFGPWSVKNGVSHVQPPAEHLAEMLTLRLHFDDADATNGALRVLPGSHREGRLTPPRIAELRAEKTEVLCAARAGDILLMRPLLLHASGRSTNPERRRRILHIEYAGFKLPNGLQWSEWA